MCRSVLSWAILLASMFYTGSLQAQIGAVSTDKTVISLSVEQAVIRGLQSNRAFLLQRLEPDIAGAFSRMERGSYNPTLFVAASIGRENATEVSRSTEAQFDVTARQKALSAGVLQRTPIGTDVEASLSTQQQDSSRTAQQHETRAGVRITQQLLRGMGPVMNLAKIRKADFDVELSEHELRAYAQMLVAELETAYWEYVRATCSIAVVRKSLDVAQVKMRDVQSSIELGAVPANDGAAAAVEVGLRRQRLTKAMQEQTVKRLALLQLTMPDVRQPLKIKVDATTPLSEQMPSVSPLRGHVEVALTHRHEIAEAALRIKQGKLEVAVTRNGVLPRLELFVDMGKTGYASAFGGSMSEMSGPTYDLTAGLRLEAVLGNQKAKGKRVRARLTLQQQTLAMENLRQLILFDAIAAYQALEHARQMVTLTEQTYHHSETALASVQARFSAGTATALAVIQAERDLLESELTKTNARVDYQLARMNLYRAEGTLLKKRGINLE